MRWLLFNLIFAASCGYALRRGGPAERITVAILVVGRVLTVLARSPDSDRYSHFQTGIFMVDLGAFVALLLLSLGTKRWWPLWMTGLQGAAVASHVVRLSSMVNAFAYYTAIALWIYPMLTLLVIGTYRKQRRLSRPSQPSRARSNG